MHIPAKITVTATSKRRGTTTWVQTFDDVEEAQEIAKRERSRGRKVEIKVGH